MSGALVFAALKCKIPDPLTKLVLICVCDRFNEDLGYAWCSVDHIAEYCACSPRTVRYRLKELQVAGILEVEARDGNTNCYRIVHSRGAANGAGLHEVQLGAANGAAITPYELLTKKEGVAKQSWWIGSQMKLMKSSAKNWGWMWPASWQTSMDGMPSMAMTRLIRIVQPFSAIGAAGNQRRSL